MYPGVANPLLDDAFRNSFGKAHYVDGQSVHNVQVEQRTTHKGNQEEEQETDYNSYLRNIVCFALFLTYMQLNLPT